MQTDNKPHSQKFDFKYAEVANLLVNCCNTPEIVQ